MAIDLDRAFRMAKEISMATGNDPMSAPKQETVALCLVAYHIGLLRDEVSKISREFNAEISEIDIKDSPR